MSEFPEGKVIGYVTLPGLLGRGPLVTQERNPRYWGREADNPYRLPSHMDPTGRKGRHGWRCDGCDAASPRTWAKKLDMVNDAKEHDCPPREQS